MSDSHPPQLGLRHIALKVKDLKKSEAFYTRLGFKVEWRPDQKNLYLSSGSDNLALHEAGSELTKSETALDHFGIVVKLPEHVDQWARYLQSQNLQLVQEPKTHRDGARSIYFKDPDDILIQILYHPPISGL
jgi:catechol 2,3-dioxygenase-like lactoylglutathione lyase family enzyme